MISGFVLIRHTSEGVKGVDVHRHCSDVSDINSDINIYENIHEINAGAAGADNDLRYGLCAHVTATEYVSRGLPGHWQTRTLTTFSLCSGVYIYGGTTYYFHLGRLHRDAEHPAVISTEREEYWIDGKVATRTYDRPGINNTSVQEWYFEGQLHRHNDLPACVRKDESRWYYKGKLHREGGLPAITGKNTKYYIHGIRKYTPGDKDDEWVF